MKNNKAMLAFALLFASALPVNVFAAAPNDQQLKELNELLKGELSAVQTYTQALKKVDTAPRAEALSENLQDHQEAVDMLRSEIVSRGGQPVADSGSWGAWAKIVQGTSNLLGDEVALKALREGEEHGLNEYKDVLKDKVFPDKTATLISDTLIENQVEHIRELDRTIDAIS